MATRTVKFMGNAYAESGSATLSVSFNGSNVFNGTVSTSTPTGTERTDTLTELFTFTIDSSLSGWIPLTINVSNGTAYFGELNGNYSGYEGYFADQAADWDPSNPRWVYTTEPVDFYRPLNENSAETDGKRNVSYANYNDEYLRSLEKYPEALGEWIYIIEDGDTLTCEYYIDPALEITDHHTYAP